jgi:hypothetical protein
MVQSFPGTAHMSALCRMCVLSSSISRITSSWPQNGGGEFFDQFLTATDLVCEYGNSGCGQCGYHLVSPSPSQHDIQQLFLCRPQAYWMLIRTMAFVPLQPFRSVLGTLSLVLTNLTVNASLSAMLQSLLEPPPSAHTSVLPLMCALSPTSTPNSFVECILYIEFWEPASRSVLLCWGRGV